jgi:hypothetical protein
MLDDLLILIVRALWMLSVAASIMQQAWVLNPMRSMLSENDSR